MNKRDNKKSGRKGSGHKKNSRNPIQEEEALRQTQYEMHPSLLSNSKQLEDIIEIQDDFERISAQEYSEPPPSPPTIPHVIQQSPVKEIQTNLETLSIRSKRRVNKKRFSNFIYDL